MEEEKGLEEGEAEVAEAEERSCWRRGFSWSRYLVTSASVASVLAGAELEIHLPAAPPRLSESERFSFCFPRCSRYSWHQRATQDQPSETQRWSDQRLRAKELCCIWLSLPPPCSLLPPPCSLLPPPFTLSY